MMAPIGVIELSQIIKNTVEELFPEGFWLIGEIVSLQVHQASGHAYFELGEKDNVGGRDARIKANCWRNNFTRIKRQFENATGTSLQKGIKILAYCHLQYHELYGLAVNIEEIDVAYTLGDFARKRSEIVARLFEEGLLHLNKQTQLPPVIQRVAVISSANAAGYEDFVRHLEQNAFNYAFHITLFPAVLQGADTEATVIRALEQINRHAGDYDVAVLIRGGGADSDLLWFDSYAIGKAIATLKIPLITGIGHEKNETVADMVAHTKLKTPTAVAHFCIETNHFFEQNLDNVGAQLATYARQFIEQQTMQLQRMVLYMEKAAYANLSRLQYRLEQLVNNFRYTAKIWHQNHHMQLTLIEQKLEMLHPQNILKRGYSITTCNGKLLRSAQQAIKGDILHTRLTDGVVQSRVE